MSSSGGVVVVVSPAALIAAGVVFPVLGILTVALQFYTRRLQEAPLMLDDWFLIPGLVGAPRCRVLVSYIQFGKLMPYSF